MCQPNMEPSFPRRQRLSALLQWYGCGGLLHVGGKAVHCLAGEIFRGSQATTANDM